MEVSADDLAYVTVDTARERIEVHNGKRLETRLRSSRFRFDPERRVWFQRFRGEGDLLPVLAWLVSQKIPLHESVRLNPRHLETLTPCLSVRFVGEGAGAKAVIETVEWTGRES